MITSNGAEQAIPTSDADKTRGLYKYFPSTDEYKIRKFLDGSVLVTPPQYFNDPFEFFFLPGRRNLTLGAAAAGAGRIQELFGEAIGVICLTDHPLNRSMWAHYASGYTGFVAEFAHAQTGSMIKDGVAYRTRCGPFGTAIKVNYVALMPGFPEARESAIRRYATKHTDWEKEREWRVFQFLEHTEANATHHGTSAETYAEQHDGRTYRLARFKPTDLTRIIVGMETKDQLVERLKTLSATPAYRHVVMQKMIADPQSQELALRPIDP